jgi:hypothetical protein
MILKEAREIINLFIFWTMAHILLFFIRKLGGELR